MGTTNTRQLRKEKTRLKILEVTSDLIRKNGVENLSLRQVAKEMVYSPSGMYEHFSSKESLVTAVYDNVIRKLSDHLNQVSNELSCRERLIALGFAYLDYAKIEPELYQLVCSKTNSRRRSLTEPILTGSPILLFSKVIQDGLDEDRFQLPDDQTVDTVTYAFWSLLHGMAMLELTHLKDFDFDFRELHIANLEGFCRGFLEAGESSRQISSSG